VADGRRCFRTDDLGLVHPDGQIEVTGRADDVVQVGGASVSLGAVAARLRSDAGVAEAEVVAVPDDTFGARLVAFVVLSSPTGAPTPRAAPVDSDAPVAGRVDDLALRLTEHVGDTLGRAAQPRLIEVLLALPLLPSGKPDRRRLLDLARKASG
jgi:O-succinylbenzoic acid--CoA ligase